MSKKEPHRKIISKLSKNTDIENKIELKHELTQLLIETILKQEHKLKSNKK